MDNELSPAGARTQPRAGGFTLIELMIVVVILSILVGIGYPSYLSQTMRANRAEGKGMLVDAAARQERFFSDNNAYTADVTELNYPDPAISENQLYRLTAAATPTTFTLTATAINRQANDADCATMTFSSTGVRGGTTNNCW